MTPFAPRGHRLAVEEASFNTVTLSMSFGLIPPLCWHSVTIVVQLRDVTRSHGYPIYDASTAVLLEAVMVFLIRHWLWHQATRQFPWPGRLQVPKGLFKRCHGNLLPTLVLNKRTHRTCNGLLLLRSITQLQPPPQPIDYFGSAVALMDVWFDWNLLGSKSQREHQCLFAGWIR